VYLRIEGVRIQVWRKSRCQVSVKKYENTVHLFIGTGRSPCKITLMPFTFINNSIVILQGLIRLFIFKSVSSSCRYTEAILHTASWLSYPSSWSSSQSSFVLTMFLYTRNLSSKVPVHMFLLEDIVKLRFWGPSEAEGPQQDYWPSLSPWPLMLLQKSVTSTNPMFYYIYILYYTLLKFLSCSVYGLCTCHISSVLTLVLTVSFVDGSS
jgi:hypothetical protein